MSCPSPLGSKMPDDLQWNWCSNNRNKVHSKCNVLGSPWNHSLPFCGKKTIFQVTGNRCQRDWGNAGVDHAAGPPIWNSETTSGIQEFRNPKVSPEICKWVQKGIQPPRSARTVFDNTLHLWCYLTSVLQAVTSTGLKFAFLSEMSACRCTHSPQSCLMLWDPMDCSPPGTSIHGVLQARKLEWAAMSSSRGSSWSRDWTHVSSVSYTGRPTTDH